MSNSYEHWFKGGHCDEGMTPDIKFYHNFQEATSFLRNNLNSEICLSDVLDDCQAIDILNWLKGNKKYMPMKIKLSHWLDPMKELEIKLFLNNELSYNCDEEEEFILEKKNVS